MSVQPLVHWPEKGKGASVGGVFPLCGAPKNPHKGPQKFSTDPKDVDCQDCLREARRLGLSFESPSENIQNVNHGEPVAASKTFQYHSPNDSQNSKMDFLRRKFSEIESFIRENVNGSGEYRGWALKDLESAAMWANKAITHTGGQ